MSHSADYDAARDELARQLVLADPEPCDPVKYDAAAYYRDFADALLRLGVRVIPPEKTQEET